MSATFSTVSRRYSPTPGAILRAWNSRSPKPSFVSDIASDADDASVVTAVIDMGNGLKLRVVAEGVETREQFAFLEDNRCSEAQGFHVSRPLSADAFAEYLRK